MIKADDMEYKGRPFTLVSESYTNDYSCGIIEVVREFYCIIKDVKGYVEFSTRKHSSRRRALASIRDQMTRR